MAFRIEWSDIASAEYDDLETNPQTRAKFEKVRRAIGYLEVDPRHKSLETHKFESIKGPNGEQVFVAHAENNTPNAYRILWYYLPGRIITIMRIIPHY